MSIDTTNITKEEKEALMKYIGGGLYLNFNKKLRQNKPLNDIELKVYKNLYSLIDKNRISEDMIVYRGIDTTEKEFKKSIGFNPSFTSTSKHKPFTPGKECCHLIIHLKKGSCAMDISRFNKQESEVLIAPGIFTVIDTYKKDYIKKIPKVDFSGGSMKVSYEEK